MEQFGFLKQTGRPIRLSVNAYGVGYKKIGKLSMKQSETLEGSEINMDQSLQLKQRSNTNFNQLQSRYKETVKQVNDLKYSKTALELKNRQLQITVQDKTKRLNQIQNLNGKFLKQEDVIKLQLYMTQKEKRIQELSAEVQILRKKNGKPLIENILQDIQQTNEAYDGMQEKLNQLIGECTNLRKQMQSQSEDLFYYQEKLRTERLQRAQMINIIQQKQKMIEVLMKDKEDACKQNSSYSLSVSMIGDTSRSKNIQEKSSFNQ